jgi:hypothetical protein
MFPSGFDRTSCSFTAPYTRSSPGVGDAAGDAGTKSPLVRDDVPSGGGGVARNDQAGVDAKIREDDRHHRYQ